MISLAQACEKVALRLPCVSGAFSGCQFVNYPKRTTTRETIINPSRVQRGQEGAACISPAFLGPVLSTKMEVHDLEGRREACLGRMTFRC